jgi:serine/threonine protein kinase
MNPEHWRKVNEVFYSALERETGGRPAFIAEACAGDEALRAEVESLVVSHQRASNFIQEPAFAAGARLLADNSEESVAGRQIGTYKVIEEIGRGGMGAVYLAARADDEYRQQVAIKLIKRGIDTDFILRRFRNERQILASLEHPNIARLLDGGSTEDGLPYLVMEYIKGQSITEYAAARGLSIRERLKLFREVCAAVQFAHQNLVIHRDIKPGNVLVTGDGVPKLLDFGIAKILDPDASLNVDPTATALRLMTPEYASPEQVRGDAITTVSDVYSLGVLLYELVSRHQPYHFKSRLPQDIAQQICEREPEPPSTAVSRIEVSPAATRSTRDSVHAAPALHAGQTRDAGMERLRRSLRGDVDNIVMMAMRKEPARRYASVGQFSEDIRRHMEGLPVIARRDTLGYRAQKFIERNKIGVAAASLVVLTLLIGLVATAWEAHAAHVQQARAEAERARAERRFNDVRRLANSLLFELHDSIAEIPGATQARELLVTRAVEYLDSLAQEAKGDPSLTRELASAYEKLGDVQGRPMRANLGNSAAAMASYQKALALRESLLALDPKNAQDRRELAAHYQTLANHIWVEGDIAGALEQDRKASAIRQRLVAEGPSNLQDRYDLATSYTYIGMHLLQEADASAALEYHQQALQLRSALVASVPDNVMFRRALSTTYEKIGLAQQYAGDTSRALENLRRSFSITQELLNADPTNVVYKRGLAIGHEDIGGVQAQTGDLHGALENYRQELTIFEELFEADQKNATNRSDVTSALENIGETQAKLGDLRDAASSHLRALSIREELAAADPDNNWNRIDLMESYAKTARVLAQTGRRADALELCRKFSSLIERIPDDKENVAHFSMKARAYSDIGATYVALATHNGTAGSNLSELRRAACDQYRHSTDIWQDILSRGKFSARDTEHLYESTRQIALCH